MKDLMASINWTPNIILNLNAPSKRIAYNLIAAIIHKDLWRDPERRILFYTGSLRYAEMMYQMSFSTLYHSDKTKISQTNSSVLTIDVYGSDYYSHSLRCDYASRSMHGNRFDCIILDVPELRSIDITQIHDSVHLTLDAVQFLDVTQGYILIDYENKAFQPELFNQVLEELTQDNNRIVRTRFPQPKL